MSTFAFGMVINFSALVAKWLKRTDIIRLIRDMQDSPYLQIGLLTNKQGMVGYVSNETETEGEVAFGFLPLPNDVLPVFSVTILTYETVEMGTKLLKGSRSEEGKDVYFIAGDIGLRSGAEFFQSVPDTTWRKQKAVDAPVENDGFEFYTSKSGFFSEDERRGIDAAIWTVICRINSGKPAVDTRQLTWGANNTPTAYGRFVAQRKQDAAWRKANKS